MKLQEKFRVLGSDKSAILAANFYNFETVKGIVMAAERQHMPIILQVSPASINYMGVGVAASLGRSVLDYFGVEGWLHLDHAHSIEIIKDCLETGFDSVMIDASEEPFKENVQITQKVVELAREYGANVEAELGYVAKLGQSQEKEGLTTPEEASEFVNNTGVDALAIAIGSAHGFYDREPNLNLDRLNAIDKAVDVALVLHGGSGIPGKQLQEGIRRGIRKINVATELKDCYMSALKQQMEDTTEIDLRQVFPAATHQLIKLVEDKLEIIKNA